MLNNSCILVEQLPETATKIGKSSFQTHVLFHLSYVCAKRICMSYVCTLYMCRCLAARYSTITENPTGARTAAG